MQNALQCWAIKCWNVSLFLLDCFFFAFFSRITKAADYKDHKIQIASCLISLKVEPLPPLLVNHSGAPLIKIVLTHFLVRITQLITQTLLVRLMYFPLSTWVLSTSSFKRVTLSVERHTLSDASWFAYCNSSWMRSQEIHQLYLWRSLM